MSSSYFRHAIALVNEVLMNHAGRTAPQQREHHLQPRQSSTIALELDGDASVIALELDGELKEDTGRRPLPKLDILLVSVIALPPDGESNAAIGRIPPLDRLLADVPKANVSCLLP